MLITLVLLGFTFVVGLSSVVSQLFMVLYITAFAVGLVRCSGCWSARSSPLCAAAGSSTATAENWMSNFLVSLVFLTVVNAIVSGQTFWIFAFICAFGLWFVGRYVPETRDRDFRSGRFRPASARRPPDGAVQRN